MNKNQPLEHQPIEDFVSLPDTISLLIRNGSLGSEYFRQAHNIRKGTALEGGYYVGYVDRKEVERIIAQIGSDELNMFPNVLGLMDQQCLEASGISKVQNHPYLDLKGRGTLIGFIDTGIDYTKSAFQYEDGSSKIKCIWDQTIKGSPPEGFYFGTEFTGAQINKALESEDPLVLVPHRDTVGHGTFLASVAAGREEGEYVGAAPEAEIIVVKLKQAEPFFYEHYLIPKWQENAYTSNDLMLGIQYIIQKADEWNLPVVICIALGSNAGGHDGFSLVEEYVTRISNITGVAIVCAAGNEGQAGHHASGRLTGGGGSQKVELSVGDQTGAIYMELWNGASDRMAVSIISPTGELVPKIPVRNRTVHTANLVLEKTRITIEYYLPAGGSGKQFTRIKMFHPTPGIWNITVHGEIILDGTYHVWMPITGFIDVDTTFLSPSPNHTIVTPATAAGVITCGAYDSRNGSLYVASSWGSAKLPIVFPNLVAPGVNVGGIFPAGPGKMSGTSVSAAITAGACALMLQWGMVDDNEVSLTSNRIRANLIRGCVRATSMEYPNVQWGYGQIDLYEAFNNMRNI